MSGNPLRITFHKTKTNQLGKEKTLCYGVAWCSLCENYIPMLPLRPQRTRLFPDIGENLYNALDEINDKAREHLFHQHGIYRLDHRDEDSSTYSIATCPEEVAAYLAA